MTPEPRDDAAREAVQKKMAEVTRAGEVSGGYWKERDVWDQALDAALTELEAVRREREALREALKAVAIQQLDDGLCWCGVCEDEEDNSHSVVCNRARAALAAPPKGEETR